MIAHRQQTRLPSEPPVRLYRSIALTFLIITIALLAVVIFTMFKKTEITIAAKEDSKTTTFVITAEAQKSGDKSLAAIVTTTDYYWKEKFYPTGSKDVEGVSKGEVVIYNKTGETQPLIKTTRLLTADGVLFRLSDRVVVPANGQATAQVYADQPGAKSDIGPSKFTIPGLNEDKQKVIYAESAKAMAGGSGKISMVTEGDMKAAQTQFAEKMKQAYIDSVSSSYSNYDEKIISVSQTAASASNEVGDETTEFTISGTSTLAIIFYNKKDLTEIANKEASKSVDISSEKILSVGHDPKISVVSTDFANKTAQLSVTVDSVVTLDANAPLLNKENFLGKSKSDIERYLVSLPHVTGMTIKFTPSWVSKAPNVPDKLKIIVKSVK